MTTRLDRKIEELQRIVETLLNLCPVTSNGIRCNLPANHAASEPHSFAIDFLPPRAHSMHLGDIDGQARFERSKCR
jgi:hypothetical protein